MNTQRLLFGSVSFNIAEQKHGQKHLSFIIEEYLIIDISMFKISVREMFI